MTCASQAYNAEKAGAKAILVADYKDERLLTMAAPEDRPEIAKLKDDITIPTALIQLVCFQRTELLAQRDRGYRARVTMHKIQGYWLWAQSKLICAFH
jgi:hypothetical protein